MMRGDGVSPARPRTRRPYRRRPLRADRPQINIQRYKSPHARSPEGGASPATCLIERKATEGDGRVVRVALSADGKAEAAAIETLALDIEGEVTAHLDGKDRKRMRKLPKRVEKGLKSALGTDVESDEDDIVDEAETDEA